MEHVRYIDRTKDYYLTQGYEKSYEWAHFANVPFTPLAKPLSECRLGLLGTSEIAVHFDPKLEDDPLVEEAFRGVYAIPSDTATGKLYSRTLDFDRNATTLDDVNSFFPRSRCRAIRCRASVKSFITWWFVCFRIFRFFSFFHQFHNMVFAFCNSHLRAVN